MKPPRCPFYPDSCTVEFHPNMQHVWASNVVKALTVTNIPGNVTNKASERAQAWNKANRKQYNARQKILMAGKRAKRGG